MSAVAAYIPVFNNAGTLPAAVKSLRAQTSPISTICVVDDGSTDSTATVAEELGTQVMRVGANRGRGHARAVGMETAQEELVLALDGTNTLAPDFVANALPFFDDPKVAGVVGIWHDPQPRNLSDRWRARHLFKIDRQPDKPFRKLLATHACVVRRSAVMQVGNYDRSLRHSEDAELGKRLEAAGLIVWYVPQCRVTPSISNPLSRVIERHWRWHAGAEEHLSLRNYLRWTAYSWTEMARRDLRARDWAAAAVSLAVPHLMFGRTLWRRLWRRPDAA